MKIIINPGTEARTEHSFDNAVVVAKHIAGLFKKQVPSLKLQYKSKDDSGWYKFVYTGGLKPVEVDIPGDEPEQVMKGEPFESRRLYVDGSSWLYGYAVSFISDALLGEQDD